MALRDSEMVDLVLKRTRLDHIKWARRDVESANVIGSIFSGGQAAIRDEVYTAEVEGSDGNLFMVLRFSPPPVGARPPETSLTIQDVSGGTEKVIPATNAPNLEFLLSEVREKISEDSENRILHILSE